MARDATSNIRNRPHEQHTFFAENKAARDARCVAKDKITRHILRRMRFKNPSKFKAVLMPALFGPEVMWLKKRGVPTKNMFAIERAMNVHSMYLNPLPGFEHFKGIKTTRKPYPAHIAVDMIPFEKVDLIYLDFFGQPDYTHLVTLYKLFQLGHIARGTRLIVTFGANRGDNFSCNLNRRLRRTPSVGQAYIDAALKWAKAPAYRASRNYKYLSRTARFIVTEVVF